MATPTIVRQCASRAPARAADPWTAYFISPVQCKSSAQTLATRPFSTSLKRCYPRRTIRERTGPRNNPTRGASPLRGDGLPEGWTLSILKDKDFRLPEPVKPVDVHAKAQGLNLDPDHGLWKFFNRERRILALPQNDHAHGRAWYPEELRQKSWEDLHRLWWSCTLERNRLRTEAIARTETYKTEYGTWESNERDKVVKQTMWAIRTVLIERYHAWSSAFELATTDPDVNMFAEEGSRAYEPRQDQEYYDEAEVETEPQSVQKA